MVTEKSPYGSPGHCVMQSGRKPIRICYVIAIMHTPRAGTERHVLQLIRSLDRKIFDPLLIVLRHSPWTREFRDPDVPLRVGGMGSLWNPFSWFGIIRLANIMRNHRTEVVELYFVEGQFVGAIAARLARVSRVFSWRRALAYRYGMKEKLMLRLTNRFVTRFLANSYKVRDASAKIERLDLERFSVIQNGIDLKDFDRQSLQPFSAEFDTFAKGKRVVTLVANLRPVKNIRCFLRAARCVALARENVVFLILGTGGEKSELMHYATHLGIEDRIYWGGSVSPTAPYLKRSTVGCLSSDSEGLPNAIVEHMAAGLPVVATRVGGIPELVTDGLTGDLVEKGDSEGLAVKILELLNDPQRGAKMGALGRRRIEQDFSLNAHMKAYHRIHNRT